MAIANGRFAVIFSLRFVAYTEASDAVHVTGFSRPSDRAHEWSRSAKPRPMKRPPNFSGIKPKSKFEEIVTVQAPRLRRPPARERRSKLHIGSVGVALSVSTVRAAASIFVLRSGCRPPRRGSVCLRLSLLSRLAPPLTPPHQLRHGSVAIHPHRRRPPSHPIVVISRSFPVRLGAAVGQHRLPHHHRSALHRSRGVARHGWGLPSSARPRPFTRLRSCEARRAWRTMRHNAVASGRHDAGSLPRGRAPIACARAPTTSSAMGACQLRPRPPHLGRTGTDHHSYRRAPPLPAADTSSALRYRAPWLLSSSHVGHRRTSSARRPRILAHPTMMATTQLERTEVCKR
jgi:hypothetical protein